MRTRGFVGIGFSFLKSDGAFDSTVAITQGRAAGTHGWCGGDGMSEIDEYVRPNPHLAVECGPTLPLSRLERYRPYAMIRIAIGQHRTRSDSVDPQIEQVVRPGNEFSQSLAESWAAGDRPHIKIIGDRGGAREDGKQNCRNVSRLQLLWDALRRWHQASCAQPVGVPSSSIFR
ncbi:hypothetical protein Arad_1315 [Rhizobium rhizogenes K84]|uniref:Uncharacterized protein n=1 Tax=Rhizobium rhizogenes (strain K84 / ATCC BAA-868) TaxID=311403 RepID=B9JAV0_RHIR8|nr:hypothetical protein Arad_1315 [Rhizobium rhizogenes K84]